MKHFFTFGVGRCWRAVLVPYTLFIYIIIPIILYRWRVRPLLALCWLFVWRVACCMPLAFASPYIAFVGVVPCGRWRCWLCVHRVPLGVAMYIASVGRVAVCRVLGWRCVVLCCWRAHRFGWRVPFLFGLFVAKQR